MKNTELHHFENWAAEFHASLCDEHQENITLAQLVRSYVDLYPGRVERLLAELVKLSREWTDVEETVAKIREARRN